MAAAKELIQEKQYNTAKHILQTVDHPNAIKWLKQIESHTSSDEKQATNKMIHVGYIILSVLIGLGGFAIGRMANTSGDTEGVPQIVQVDSSDAEQDTSLQIEMSPTPVPSMLISISGHPAYEAQNLVSNGSSYVNFRMQTLSDGSKYGIYEFSFDAGYSSGRTHLSLHLPDATMPDAIPIGHVELRELSPNIARLWAFLIPVNDGFTEGRGVIEETIVGEAIMTRMDTALSGEFSFTIDADDPTTLEDDTVQLTVTGRMTDVEIKNLDDYFAYLDER